MNEILRSFVAINAKGEPFIIHVRLNADGQEELQTAGGLKVRRVDRNKYELELGSAVLVSDDSDAP